MNVPSHPQDLIEVLKHSVSQLIRAGLEAGPLARWLFSGHAEAAIPVIGIGTRSAKAFPKAHIDKSGRNDAPGIAQMMRVNLFRPVHVKTVTSLKQLALSTARKLLQEKAICIENDIPGPLRNFGLKVGVVVGSNSKHEFTQASRRHARAPADSILFPLASPRLLYHSTVATASSLSRLLA